MVPACRCIRPFRRPPAPRDTWPGMVVVTMTENTRIVVGVDGSPPSIRALRWAVRQAELTGAEVEAVTVWSYPSGYGFAAVSDGAVDFEGDAGKVLVDALAEVSDIAPDVVIEPSVVHGHAADVLVREAKDADLLVVGSGGHGGFTGMLLGSVSQHCVQHAGCPVLVVRDGR
jgi:nucleotide-binding universal stress UspA family protein